MPSTPVSAHVRAGHVGECVGLAQVEQEQEQQAERGDGDERGRQPQQREHDQRASTTASPIRKTVRDRGGRLGNSELANDSCSRCSPGAAP